MNTTPINLIRPTFKGYSNQSITSQKGQSTPELQLRNSVSKDTLSFGNIKTIMLKSGVEEAESLVTVVMMSLRGLQEEGLPGMLTLYDFAEKCKNPAYKLEGDAEQKLKGLGLVQQDGKIHQSIKNIVRSASEGEGLEFRLVNPLANK